MNSSITEGVVPDDMKIAKVKPLHKKNSKLDVGNYRPVSILCIVSKILERAVYVQFESFLRTNNLIYEHQSGFRKSHSTDTCLIYLLDYIRTNSSKGLLTGMVMMDLQKAFDTVNHDILCDKLDILGVKSISWFKSYLSGRYQKVSIGKVFSDSIPITCGVPQGSILGPLLFLCYVNDMVTSIDSDCKLILYADDSTILFSHKDPKIIAQKLGKVLERCSDWLVDNKLSLHLGKTECMLFGSKSKINKLQNFSISCNDQTIKSSSEVKYLGLNIDCYLSGDKIVKSILSKVNGRLHFLYRYKNCLSEEIKKQLCPALLLCHFDYSSSSWYEGLSKSLKHKLQVAQNKVVRFIKDYTPRTSVTNKVLSDLKLLNVNDRVRQLRLNHIHKVYYNKSPSYLKELFKVCRISNLRSSNFNFVLPQNDSYVKNTFFYNATKDWNSLPDNIRSIDNIQRFKTKVKHFLSNENDKQVNNMFIYY